MVSMNKIVFIVVILATFTLFCQAYPQSQLVQLRPKRQLGTCINNVGVIAKTLIGCVNDAIDDIADIAEGLTKGGLGDIGSVLSSVLNIVRCVVGKGLPTTVDGALNCVKAILDKVSGIVQGACGTVVATVNVATGLLVGALVGAVAGLAGSLPGLIAQLHSLCDNLNLGS